MKLRRKPRLDGRVGLEGSERLAKRGRQAYDAEAPALLGVHPLGILPDRLRRREIALDALDAGMHEHAQRQIRVGRGIGRPVLDVVLAGDVGAGRLEHRRDAQARLPVAEPEIRVGGAPSMRMEAQIRAHAGRRDRAQGRHALQDSRGERRHHGAQAMGPVRVPGHRLAAAVPQAHVDVHPVADALGRRHGGEGHAMAEAMGGGSCQLADDERMVGRAHRRLRAMGHLVLPRAEFRQVGIDVDPAHAQGMQIGGAELAGVSHRAEIEGRCEIPLGAAVDELVLQRGHQVQAGRPLEAIERPPEEQAGAVFPGPAVGLEDIAQEEELGRRAVAEIDVHPRIAVGHEDQVAPRAEVIVGDAFEGMDQDVRRRPADAAGEPGLQIAHRKSLAAHLAGDIGAADHDVLVAVHQSLPPAADRSALSKPRVAPRMNPSQAPPAEQADGMTTGRRAEAA